MSSVGDDDGRTPPARKGAGEHPDHSETSAADSAWGGDSPPELDDGWPRRPDFETRGRVTIDFSGPPLDLPASSEAPLDESSGELTLDTSEIETSGPLPARESDGLITETGDDALDLDLSGFEPKPPPGLISGDAWILDRRHRSSPPPTVAQRFGGKPSTRPPPIDPERMRGRTNPRFPAAVMDPPAPIGDSSEGDALGLVDRSQPSNQDLDLVSDMAERYALGDFTGALRAAELLLGMSPDHPEASRYARSSRERLEQLFSSRLGPLTRVPRVGVPDHEIRWLGLDHRAGFLLSRVDGCHSIEEILDVSGMPRLEALKTLSELVGAGAVLLDEV
jgi:hypothetical protein